MKIGLQLKKKNHYLRGNNNVQMPPLTPVIEKSFSGILSGGNRYTYVLNNPLKYTDPSGYTFRYRDFEELQRWYEGMAMYYEMNQINANWMDQMRQIRGGGGSGPDGWYSVYQQLKRKGVNISPSEVMKQYDEQMNSHEFNGTITIKHTVYTDWFKITKNKSGEEISRKYMYTTSKDFFYDFDTQNAANSGGTEGKQRDFSDKQNEIVDKYLEIGSNPVMGPIADGVEKLIPVTRGFGRLPSLVSIIYDTRQYNQGNIEKWQYDIRLGYNILSMVTGMPTTTTSITHEKTLGFFGEFSIWLENYVNNIPRMYYGW